MNNFITKDENGRLQLEGSVLLPGDLVEIELVKGAWFIGQIELIDWEYKITIFDSDWGRLIPCHSKCAPSIRARRLANRPVALPPFGESWRPPRENLGDPEQTEE